MQVDEKPVPIQQKLSIFIDTNALWDSGSPDKPHWVEFREVHYYYDCEIFISSLVVFEIVGRHLERLSEEERALKNSLEQVTQHFKRMNISRQFLGLHATEYFNEGQVLSAVSMTPSDEKLLADGRDDFDLFVNTTKQMLDVLFGKSITLQNWTLLGHKKIVERCSVRKFPFPAKNKTKDGTKSAKDDGKDKGYKDYLFWLSVLEEAKGKSEVIVITDDLAFYADGGNEPHPDLIHDLEQIELDRSKVRLFRDIESFNKERVRPRLEADTAFLNQLKATHLEPIGSKIHAFTPQIWDSVKDYVHRLTGDIFLFPMGRQLSGVQYSVEPIAVSLVEVTSTRKTHKSGLLATGRVILVYSLEMLIVAGISSVRSMALECPVELSLRGDILEVPSVKGEGSKPVMIAICQVQVWPQQNKVSVNAVIQGADNSEHGCYSEKIFPNIPIITACVNDLIEGRDDLGLIQKFDSEHMTIPDSEIPYRFYTQPVAYPVLEKWGFGLPNDSLDDNS
jgi:hypothetical protein